MKQPELESSGLSVTGPVREDNQDSILVPNGSAPALPGFLFAVADGMGGYSYGGMASKLAVDALLDRVQEAPSAPDKALRGGLEAANLGVYKAAQKLGAGRMGTTLTGAYVIGEFLHLVHVGDSRAYLVRDGKASLLTSDHTVVGDMVRSKLIPPDRMRTHAQRSILTRAVGLGLFIQPDQARIKIQPDDRIILCSDGVWSVVQDEEFARCSRDAADTRILSERLVDLAIEHQTDDNCSVVAFHVHGFHAAQAAEERGLFGWVRH
jgi:protein phosphatase